MTTTPMTGAEAEVLLRQAHTPGFNRVACFSDGYAWPCPIILALDAAGERAEQAEAQLADALAELWWAFEYFEDRGFSSHRIRLHRVLDDDANAALLVRHRAEAAVVATALALDDAERAVPQARGMEAAMRTQYRAALAELRTLREGGRSDAQ